MKKSLICIALLTILLSACSIVLLVVYWNSGRYIFTIPHISTMVAVGLVILFIAAFRYLPVCSKSHAFQYIGRHSLEIFLFHCFFTAGNRIVLTKVGISNVWISLFANTVISITLPILLSLLLRKMHLDELAFKPFTFIVKHTVSSNSP